MGEFFGSIYCIFEEFFGLNLANYLWGQTSPDQTTNRFIGIGLIMFFISLLVAVVFYYVVNKPKFNKWWAWGIFLVANMVINFFVGWQWALKDFYAGKMVALNSTNNLLEPLPINETDILHFGVSNMLISLVAFFVISMIIKWWSTNCPDAPFNK